MHSKKREDTAAKNFKVQFRLHFLCDFCRTSHPRIRTLKKDSKHKSNTLDGYWFFLLRLGDGKGGFIWYKIHFKNVEWRGRAESTISLPTTLEILMVEKNKEKKSQKAGRWERKDKFTSKKKDRCKSFFPPGAHRALLLHLGDSGTSLARKLVAVQGHHRSTIGITVVVVVVVVMVVVDRFWLRQRHVPLLLSLHSLSILLLQQSLDPQPRRRGCRHRALSLLPCTHHRWT